MAPLLCHAYVEGDWRKFFFYRCDQAKNSKAVIRAADISTAALPTRITNLRRLVIGVQRARKFPRGGAEICQKLHFPQKVARSSELICRARVLDVGARCRGGSEISPPPRTGGPASIPNTPSVVFSIVCLFFYFCSPESSLLSGLDVGRRSACLLNLLYLTAAVSVVNSVYIFSVVLFYYTSVENT